MPSWLRFSLFLAVTLALCLLVSVYAGRRFSRGFDLGPRARRTLVVVLCLAPLLLVLGRLLERWLGAAAAAIAATGSVILLGTLVTAALLVPIDLVGGFVRRLRARREAPPSQPPNVEAPGDPERKAAPGSVELSRRSFVQQATVGAALTTGFGSALYGAVYGRHDYVVPEIPVAIDGLSPRLSGYRIVQLSDLHFGQFVGEPERRSALELVRRTRADLIVLTGDLVDHAPRHAAELGRLVRQLSELGARDGVVVIPGNHDYYAGIDVVLGAVRRAGANILINAGRVIGQGRAAFALLGVDDVMSRRNGFGPGPDLERAIAGIPSELPRVLLCHNPSFFPKAAGRVALQLSGHTHGGQINPGVRPAALFLPYVAGLYREKGSHLYVNRGFGTAGPPVRIGAPPEVTLVVLTS